MKEEDIAKNLLAGKTCDVCEYYLVCLTNENKKIQAKFKDETCEKWVQYK